MKKANSKEELKSEIATAKCMAAQGDVMFIRVASLPSDAKLVEQKGTRAIVAHSETGHHHTVDATGTKLYEWTDPNVCFLQLTGEYVDVVHHRDYDTHAPIRLEGGPDSIWKIQRQSEWTPEGWRQVQD